MDWAAPQVTDRRWPETELERGEESALLRVATLVARGATQANVFATVAEEAAHLFGAVECAVLQKHGRGIARVVAVGGVRLSERLRVGTRLALDEDSLTALVVRGGRAVRIDDSTAAGLTPAHPGADGTRSAIGCPIVIDAWIWGAMTVTSDAGDAFPPGTEICVARFGEFVAAAIANDERREELTTSRARLLRCSDEARRGVVRDLHDGAQRRLVHTVVTLKLAQRALREGDGKAESLLGETLAHAEHAIADLRELAHRIFPAVLARGGLAAGIDAVVSRLDVPVDVDVPPERFPAEIETSAYFIVAGALINVARHAHADRAEVTACVEDEMLCVEVRDDGIGGADCDGPGLVGLADRAIALGGRLTVDSPPGHGTLIVARLPLPPA
jgi:signal transduction histidine kinase